MKTDIAAPIPEEQEPFTETELHAIRKSSDMRRQLKATRPDDYRRHEQFVEFKSAQIEKQLGLKTKDFFGRESSSLQASNLYKNQPDLAAILRENAVRLGLLY